MFERSPENAFFECFDVDDNIGEFGHCPQSNLTSLVWARRAVARRVDWLPIRPALAQHERRAPWPYPHSYLSATIGSTLDARRAGT